MRGQYARSLQCFPVRQAGQIRDERFRLLINVRVLLVGVDYILALPPQGVHRIELGSTFGQPE